MLPTSWTTTFKWKSEGKVAYKANPVESDSNDIIAAVVESNMVGNKSGWVLDTGASRHFCANKNLLDDFKDVAEGECVYMGNQSITGVYDKGYIYLKLASGKTLALNNVLFVPMLRRNLISDALINKVGLKIVLEADKVVLTKNGELICRKGILK